MLMINTTLTKLNISNNKMHNKGAVHHKDLAAKYLVQSDPVNGKVWFKGTAAQTPIHITDP
jgi:hypothetical protein